MARRYLPAGEKTRTCICRPAHADEEVAGLVQRQAEGIFQPLCDKRRDGPRCRIDDHHLRPAHREEALTGGIVANSGGARHGERRLHVEGHLVIGDDFILIIAGGEQPVGANRQPHQVGAEIGGVVFPAQHAFARGTGFLHAFRQLHIPGGERHNAFAVEEIGAFAGFRIEGEKAPGAFLLARAVFGHVKDAFAVRRGIIDQRGGAAGEIAPGDAGAPLLFPGSVHAQQEAAPFVEGPHQVGVAGGVGGGGDGRRMIAPHPPVPSAFIQAGWPLLCTAAMNLPVMPGCTSALR